MGIFGRGGGRRVDSDGSPQDPGRDADRESVQATGLIGRLMDVGIDGKGRFDSAAEVAADVLKEHREPQEAVRAIVRRHRRLAGAGGFVTSLGGFVTMAVALPANVLGFYALATRMVASIAVVRGYDVSRPEVRTAVLLTLTGADSSDVLKKAGYLSTGRVASLTMQRLPPPVLLAVNKAIGFRLLRQVGSSSLTSLGRAVPLLGGVVGAGMDVRLLNSIAQQADVELPARAEAGS